MTPGPHFGPILEACYDLQLEEKIVSREEALIWLTEYLCEMNMKQTRGGNE